MAKPEGMRVATRDALTAKRVYGDPYERDGVTIVPAASVRGGAGGGEGETGGTTPGGKGSGFGMTARPVGAFQIREGEVSWIPAADTTKVIVLAEVLAIVALLVLRSILRARRSGT